ILCAGISFSAKGPPGPFLTSFGPKHFKTDRLLDEHFVAGFTLFPFGVSVIVCIQLTADSPLVKGPSGRGNPKVAAGGVARLLSRDG
ncbi:MAG: hypothetical protein ACYCYJ_11660, partial [Trichloromonadaceae bacterium]